MKQQLSALPTTLGEALLRAAIDFPDRGIGIFDGRGRQAERRTYREVYDDALGVAARLVKLGVEEKEPVLVAMPTSWPWFEAWFGLLLRGAWPVAASGAGAMAAASAQLEKIDKVMRKIGASRIISGESLRRQAREYGLDWPEKTVITREELLRTDPEVGFSLPQPGADDIAFLQLTSGSTGVPRAVMISHGAALHNPVASSEAIGAPFGAPVHEWADSMVSWLPMFHDMGLIGCLMMPVLTGLDTWLLRPQTFLARPHLWLEELGACGTTISPAPNFGYQLCVERLATAALKGVDLSGFKAALTGAEMIRKETIDDFCSRFGPIGFKAECFRPCYGLAEGTLAVTFDCRGQGVRTLPMPAGDDAEFALAEVVSTGEPIRDTEVNIVAPDGARLPDDAIGEIRFSGPGVFSGYFNDASATAEALREDWFYTGDLGFMHDGELYITGRSKEVLILHGHNLMPEEFERIADQVTGGGGLLRSAAFSVARGSQGEQPVLIVEVKDRDPEAIALIDREIRVRIGRTLGLPLADVVFVRRGRIPRTSSGKMKRGDVRREYLDGRLRDE